MVNSALSEASSTLEQLGQVLEPVICTEPGDQLIKQLFSNRTALEHAIHLVSTLSNPNAQYEILYMEDWNSTAYEEWLGKYGQPLPHVHDPVDPGLKPYMPVNCPHGSPSPVLYGPSGGIRRERLAKATVKTRDSDNEGSSSSSSSESEESGEEEESDELGMYFIYLILVSNPFIRSFL